MNGFDKLTTSMENKVRKGKDRLGGKKTLKVAGILEEFEKDDIKKNIDITELFQDFGVKLQKRGSPPGKSWMGLCPWHEDKTPSLSVDREKGLYNCFGCGESGDAFDLVEKMKGCDFKDALAYLKAYKPSISNVSSTISEDNNGKNDEKVLDNKTGALEEPAPEDHSTSLKEETKGELQTGAGSADFSLKTISEYYHKRFYENPKAIEYLKQRGFKIPELYERYQIGFSDSSLLNIIGETQRKELIEAGILNQKEETAKVWEHFNNCLIFPILDENDQPVSFYGRDISADSNPVTSTGRAFKHRYLKGTHKGIWNRKASKVYSDELILTECIIDALSLIELGFQNVQPIYGTNGLTDEHLQSLKEDRVKTVILALDNDPSTSSGQAGPGQKAAEKLKELLINECFKVKILNCYGGKDWNEALVNGKLEKEELKALISELAVFQKEDELKEGFKAREDKGQHYFTCLEGLVPMIYRLTGVKEIFANSLKVTVKACLKTSPDDFFLDTVDLYAFRSRSGFASHLRGQFGIEQKRAEKDLLNILEYLERKREEKLSADEPEKKEMTEEERRTGLEFLKSPELLDMIVKDMETLGYMGEDMNKKLLYLCGTSRKLDNPISVMIISESASGKSYLVDTVRKLMPEDETIEMTSLSEQALNFIKDLLNKFLVFGEAGFSDQIDGQIREMLSGNRLSRLVTMKDEKTGELITKLYKKDVIVASVTSTTRNDINPENASRYFLINADESREQTKRIFEAQRQKYTLSRHYAKAEQIPAIISKHHAAQKLLQKRLIVNPIAPFMDFPDGLMRLRRDHDRFIDLMAVICFLRQYQKPIQTDIMDGKKLEYIECDDTDYITAREFIVSGMLSSTLDELPKSVKRFYDEFREICRNKGREANLKVTEAEVQQRDIRKRIDWLGIESIKKYLRILVRYEYIVLRIGGNRGQRFAYSLAADEPIENIDISMIPTIEEIRGKMAIRKVGKSG